jgi:integrase
MTRAGDETKRAGAAAAEGEGGATGVEARLLEILPVSSVEALVGVLTEDDAETLRHLFRKSIPDNTLRAIASDLGYLEAWARAATAAPLPWPAPADLVLKFVAHHLFDPKEKGTNPRHGMPDLVAEALLKGARMSAAPPHAPSTVRRRLSHWKRLHEARGLAHPFDDAVVRAALKAACKASDRAKTKKSSRPITRDVLEAMIAQCDPHRRAGRRDRALLLVAFGSGGRRRSEMSALRCEDIRPLKDDAGGPLYEIALRRAKGISPEDGQTIIVAGRAARALEVWLKDLEGALGAPLKGGVFRRIDRWSDIGADALSPGAVNALIKARLEDAGLEPKEYSAHGLRSGYLTEARRRGVPLELAMAHSKHKSYNVAAGYVQEADRRRSKAARLLD